MNNLLRFPLSYIHDFLIEKKISRLNGTLEVRYSKGKLILDTEKANYSFASLHRVFQKTFHHISLQTKTLNEVLILGFGAGSVANILTQELHLNPVITGIEHDPAVLELAKKYFELEHYKKLVLHCEDAAQFVYKTEKLFDLIVVDVFRDTDVPEKLMEDKFITHLINLCSMKGTICFNVMIDTQEKKKKIESLKMFFEKNKMSTEIFSVEHFNRVLIARKN